MILVLFQQPNSQYKLHVDIKGVSAKYFGTRVPSSGRTKCQF